MPSSTMAAFILCVIMVLPHVNSVMFNKNDISTWFNYDIAALQSEPIQSIITKASNALEIYGTFQIRGFLKPTIKDLIATELQTVQHIPRKTTRTVFQDKGDFTNFDETSPRNFMLDNSMEFVSGIHIKQHMADSKAKSYVFSLYNYPPLLDFWKAIIKSTELYQSTDEAGAVYGFYGKTNDWFSWHFDESHFSCIFMISKPKIGGRFRYIIMQNPLKTVKTPTDNRNKWKELNIVLHHEREIGHRIKGIDANEGDVYCIFGNHNLHQVTKIKGTKDRSVFVMTYGDTPDFEHTSNVHNLNQWKEKHEL